MDVCDGCGFLFKAGRGLTVHKNNCVDYKAHVESHKLVPLTPLPLPLPLPVRSPSPAPSARPNSPAGSHLSSSEPGGLDAETPPPDSGGGDFDEADIDDDADLHAAANLNPDAPYDTTLGSWTNCQVVRLCVQLKLTAKKFKIFISTIMDQRFKKKRDCGC